MSTPTLSGTLLAMDSTGPCVQWIYRAFTGYPAPFPFLIVSYNPIIDEIAYCWSASPGIPCDNGRSTPFYTLSKGRLDPDHHLSAIAAVRSLEYTP